MPIGKLVGNAVSVAKEVKHAGAVAAGKMGNEIKIAVKNGARSAKQHVGVKLNNQKALRNLQHHSERQREISRSRALLTALAENRMPAQELLADIQGQNFDEHILLAKSDFGDHNAEANIVQFLNNFQDEPEYKKLSSTDKLKLEDLFGQITNVLFNNPHNVNNVLKNKVETDCNLDGSRFRKILIDTTAANTKYPDDKAIGKITTPLSEKLTFIELVVLCGKSPVELRHAMNFPPTFEGLRMAKVLKAAADAAKTRRMEFDAIKDCIDANDSDLDRRANAQQVLRNVVDLRANEDPTPNRRAAFAGMVSRYESRFGLTEPQLKELDALYWGDDLKPRQQ